MRLGSCGQRASGPRFWWAGSVTQGQISGILCTDAHWLEAASEAYEVTDGALLVGTHMAAVTV
jgi:hypothetical protein